MLFDILKWVHILLAIAAVGANITYSVWIQRGMANRDALSFALRGVKFINNRIANPGYGLLLFTGIGMALVAETSLLSPWLLLSLILWFALILVGMFGYTPTLRKQIALAIIFLMVFKPALWG